jgi:hypothetical protein
MRFLTGHIGTILFRIADEMAVSIGVSIDQVEEGKMLDGKGSSISSS